MRIEQLVTSLYTKVYMLYTFVTSYSTLIDLCLRRLAPIALWRAPFNCSNAGQQLGDYLKMIMRQLLISIILYSFFQANVYAQNAEYKLAERVFKKEYKRQQFAPFNGKVETIDENTFRYGEKVLNIDTENKAVMTIFSRGIFHPDIIGGKETIKALTKIQLDTMSIERQVFYNLSRNDSIRIGEVEELRQLNPNFKTKRFVFWLYQKGMLNPTECYFELYNSGGTKKMTMEEFISGSTVTFYYKGTVII